MAPVGWSRALLGCVVGSSAALAVAWVPGQILGQVTSSCRGRNGYLPPVNPMTASS